MSKQIFITETLVTTLPFKECLTWENFQLLCTDILKTDARFTDARDFLKQGNAQDGIDIYAIPNGASKITVAQCKLEQYISPKALHEIVSTFLHGGFATDTKEFILCTSFDFKTSKAEQAISEVREKLKKAGIEFILWDKSGLESELRCRPQPQLITRYFGTKIAEAFYGDIFAKWIKEYRVVKKYSYQRRTDYIERTITFYDELKERETHFFLNKERKSTLCELYEWSISQGGKKIVILSTAGFGKTWEAENLAAYYSDENSFYFPLRTYLIDYEGQSIESLLEQYSNWQDVPKEALLLVLDGLDEIRNVHLQSFINSLNQFVESNPQVNILISSRFNFYDLSFPPLRHFEVYVLDEFTPEDINAYVVKSLPEEHLSFRKKLDSTGFSEYLTNPYYLTRLVRFYKDKSVDFPKNKPALFDKILFEGFDADKNKYKAKLSREEFKNMAEKVAFCMTLLGKSRLSDDEMETIITDDANLSSFKQFFVFTKGVSENKGWSFEHKNLQEYLCASFFQRIPFNSLKQLVTLSEPIDKLQPWFLNTMSFLFSAANENLFDALFRWLNDKQHELLVRFEKDRVPKEIRLEILERILEYYGSKDLSLYGSSNFTIEELANFVDIDNETIDFLERKLNDSTTNDWLAYDITCLFSACKRPHVYKVKLTEILLRSLSTRNHFDRFVIVCIRSLIELKYFDKETANKILNSPIDFKNPDIRLVIVSYLNQAELEEEYFDFIIASIAIYPKEGSSNGLNSLLASIIANSKSPNNIKKVLRIAISDSDFLSDRHSSRKTHLGNDDIEKLLSNAQVAYTTDKSILPLVYKVFVKYPNLTYHYQLPGSFRQFFEMTSGCFLVFKKMYKNERNGHNWILLVNKEGCDFYLEEYKAGRITDFQMIQFRNRVSHEDRALFLEFQAILDKEFEGKFIIPDFYIDHENLKDEYANKNQEMLLNRDVFFTEVDRIFEAIGKTQISFEDLWDYENRTLLSFQYSLAYKTIQSKIKEDTQSKEGTIGYLRDDEKWKWFQIKSIQRLLIDSNSNPIDNKLIEIANSWCLEKLETLDYLNSVSEPRNGYITYNRGVEFNNKLFCLLNLDVEDRLLFKILPSIFSIDDESKENGLVNLIIKKVQNKELMKAEVLENIKRGLPSSVLEVHFTICKQLGIAECLRELYDTIMNDNRFTNFGRKKLTNYYFELGGNLEDFRASITLASVEEHYSSWNWHLIDKAKDYLPQVATPILINVLNSIDQPDTNKIHACYLLFQLHQIEAIYYWRDYILNNSIAPFDYNQDVVIQHAPEIPLLKILPVLMEVLEFTYKNNLHQTLKFPDSIEDAVYAILRNVALKSTKNLKEAIKALEISVSKFQDEIIVRNMEYFKERITQDYYKQLVPNLSLEEVLNRYEDLKSSTTILIAENNPSWLFKNKEWVIGAIVAIVIFLLSIVAHHYELL